MNVPQFSVADQAFMREALAKAARGQGAVEPNPMVGCVIVANDEIIGRGWHQQFGGSHAEVFALAQAGERARGATMFVTLEPCCHFGKTPPCTQAIIAAGVARVVVAMADPFPAVGGKGTDQLRAAGITIEVGLLEAESRWLNAPYLKLVRTGRPFILAKWAMTLDGKIATRTGDSRWVSRAAARQIVHQIRGRVDGILVGKGTLLQDDPLLRARPPGARTATRVVATTGADVPATCQLVASAREVPVLIAAGAEADAQQVQLLTDAGCEVLLCPGDTHAARLDFLLAELGRRRMTNILVEGGSQLLGSLLDARQIDEAHVFVAPKLLGGADAPTAVAGIGVERMPQALHLERPVVRQVGEDTYISGRIQHSS